MRRLLGVLGGRGLALPWKSAQLRLDARAGGAAVKAWFRRVMWLTSVAHAASVSSLPHTRSREDTDRAGAYSDSKSETTTAERVADFGWENGKLEPGIALAMLSGRLLHAR